MVEISIIPAGECRRVNGAPVERQTRLALIADICRLNALSAVKLAGSGHLGSSFSAMDIVVWLYYQEMNTMSIGLESSDRDIYFSSKGHDVPGLYAVLYSLGIIPQERFLKLRRIGGLDGHPDVGIPGIEANSGSLGMGISKAKGMALAKKLQGHGGRVLVLTGDGELQEGQIWESLQTTASQQVHNVHVIVDCNKIQTDKPVEEIIGLGDLQRKIEVFGWHVERCDGHDFVALEEIFTTFETIHHKPKLLIADTVKGKGISFMEGPTALRDDEGMYRWHAGAPDDGSFEAGFQELLDRLQATMNSVGLEPLVLELVEKRERSRPRLKDTAEKVVDAYGEALVELGRQRQDLVVLDADLSQDCGLRPFEKTFPDRFFENGIAEQDMVSTAGGLALSGYLPVVNTFAVFLASRANEQIYTNATENTKIIYVCHYGGLIPAGPGKSHQSLRDISLFGALPNIVVLEPCNALETQRALEWCVNQARENCMLRLAISPSPRTIALPANYQLVPAEGSVVADGSDAVIFGYGPVMLNECLTAAELLEKKGFALKVVNMPWLNRVNIPWLEEVVGDCGRIFSIDNHAPFGALGDCLANAVLASEALKAKTFKKLAVHGQPACGTPVEVLAFHGLDGQSLADTIGAR